MKERKKISKYAGGDVYEGQFKNDKKKEKELIDLQIEIFMKASLKMVYMKEKELKNLKMGTFMKASLKIIKETEKEFLYT